MSAYVAPNESRARCLSDEVNRRLAASLRYVFAEVGAQLEIDSAAAAAWLERLADAKRSFPLVHALFHAVVAEVQVDNIPAAKKYAQRLLAQPLSKPAGLTLLNLDDDRLGPEAVALFQRFVDIEDENRLDLTAAAQIDVDRVTGMFAVAREMMAQHDPELLGEFEALVTDVLLVGQAKDHRFTLGAVSCFETWGGLFLNPGLQHDALDLVGTIAHECTHLLLFAYALDEPLIMNPRDELHYSPLRDAPRSMDGIYHAAIVSARMTHAFRRQLKSDALSAPLVRLAHGRIASSIDNFERGLAVIRESGRLSPLAEAILEDAIELVRGEAPGMRLIA
jgi:hypothetical protein